MHWLKLPSGKFVNVANLFFVSEMRKGSDAAYITISAPGDETPITLKGPDAIGLSNWLAVHSDKAAI